MAGQTTFNAIINSVVRPFLGGSDSLGDVIPGHTLFDVNGNAINSSNPLAVAQPPLASSSFGIAPVFSSNNPSSLVLKATPGNLYGAYCLAANSGYLLILNAAVAPAANAAVAPQDVIPVVAGQVAGISYSGMPPEYFSAGIVMVLSSTITTFTPLTAQFLHGSVA